MSDAELAEASRLAAPLAADVAVSRMMGFHVVGASRPATESATRPWFGGVAALVLLPAVLVGSAEHPAMAPPVPAGVMVSPEPLLLANTTQSGWQPRAPAATPARSAGAKPWRGHGCCRRGRRAGRVGAAITMEAVHERRWSG